MEMSAIQALSADIRIITPAQLNRCQLHAREKCRGRCACIYAPGAGGAAFSVPANYAKGGGRAQ